MYKNHESLLFFIIGLLTTTSVFGQHHDIEEEVGPPAVEILPSFPGGQASFKKFVRDNLKYPPGTTDYVGKVYISVHVATDGTLTNISLVKGLCDICDKNAIDVVKKMPRWTPGTTNGKIVVMRTLIPIEFEL